VKRSLLLLTVLFAAVSALAGTGRVVIVTADPPGLGFNDPTPREPIAGNTGTTLGQQRLNVLQQAGARWSSVLDTNVDIRIRAQFNALDCDETSAVLASARAESWHINFTNAPRSNVYYPAPLANKFAGRDLAPNDADIFIQFNRDVDGPVCFGDRGYYYGLDVNEGDQTSMFTVALHEIGHGLGMSGRGVDAFGGPSIYDTFMFDRSVGKTWDQMSKAERQVSSTNSGNLAWNGPNTSAKAPQILERPIVLASGAANYEIGTASFGTPVNRASMSGAVVAARDAENTEGPSTLDGCTAYENSGDVAGKIALVDRGTCTFVVKALNAQSAGAVGLIIADNRKDASGCGNVPPGMSGNNPAVFIPVVSVTQDDGAVLRSQTGASAQLRLDSTRLAGTTTEGFVRLYAPCTENAGSSLYHWDTAATPNLLMEPFINGDLIDSVDLSIYQLMDIGWTQPPRTGRRVLKR
jgi:hypothetical protein